LELGMTVAYQVVIMLLLIVVGYFCYKKALLTDEGVKNLSTLLLMVVTPCILIDAYQRDFEMAMVKQFLIAAGVSVLIHAIAIAGAQLVFCKEKNDGNAKIQKFAMIYSNCGFMGIPLLNAALGSEGVFIGSAYLAVFNILYWTHGVFLYTGDKKILLSKKAVLNPGVLGMAAGLLLFFLQIRLPGVLGTAVASIADVNTPIAMLVIGTFLAKNDLLKALKNKNVYIVSALRLIVVPLVVILLLKLLQIDEFTATAILLPAAAPAATVGSLFAIRYKLDPVYASQIISISTVLSIITIPLIAMLGLWIL